jgi:hypothetical protein
MVIMKNKVTKLPPPSCPRQQVPNAQPMILFTLGDQRFAVQWTVTELSAEPAKVISIHEHRHGRRKSDRRDVVS